MWDAYKWLKEHNILPASGGWTEQTSKFIRCVKYVDLINLKFEKHLKQSKKVKEDWAAKFNNMMAAKRGKK